MAGNSFGKIFTITTFGESHGKGIGVIVDGCPAGLEISLDKIQKALDRRKPGQSAISSPRKESDIVKILSGIFENKTTGTPITLLIENEDARPTDYSEIAKSYRPSHADYTYQQKYGIRDHRGGGRSSARETAARVASGSIAMQLLEKYQIKINAYVSAVGTVKSEKLYSELNFDLIEENIVRCPDTEIADKMIELIEQVKDDGDTLGGSIACVIENCPIGLGEPVFDKLHADLGKAMLSINAVKGFEYGSGFAGTKEKGSKQNDIFILKENKNSIKTETNNSGGIQGGISNGEDIYFTVGFKPVATIMQDQQTISSDNEEVTLMSKGRHDPCVVPRAVPIVEAMAALVIADHLLRNKIYKNN